MATLEEAYYEADSFWSGDSLRDDFNSTRYDATVAMIPKDTKTLLDVGCGNGIFAEHLSRLRPDVRIVGMDRSVTALGYAKFKVEVGSIDEIPFRDNGFDCVTCLQVLEHLPVPIYAKALSELARATRRYAVISVPFEEKIGENSTTCPSCKTCFDINLHLRAFDMAVLENLFSAHGGRLVDHVYPARKPVPMITHRLRELIRQRRDAKSGFRSPICPLCGFSENSDDLTAKAAASQMASPSRSMSSISKGFLRALEGTLPTTVIPGYWVICRYEFQK